MKEATGELNMTVIAVVAIAAVGAFFYAFIWPGIQRNLRLNTACNAAGQSDYQDGDITCTGGQCCVDNACKTCSNDNNN